MIIGVHVTSRDGRGVHITSRDGRGSHVTSRDGRGSHITSRDSRGVRISSRDSRGSRITSRDSRGVRLSSCDQRFFLSGFYDPTRRPTRKHKSAPLIAYIILSIHLSICSCSNLHLNCVLLGAQKKITANEFPERVEPMPYTLFPSRLPGHVLEKTRRLHVLFQTLIYKVSNDHEFMKDSLKE